MDIKDVPNFELRTPGSLQFHGLFMDISDVLNFELQTQCEKFENLSYELFMNTKHVQKCKSAKC
jgi:hypothetical protein